MKKKAALFLLVLLPCALFADDSTPHSDPQAAAKAQGSAPDSRKGEEQPVVRETVVVTATRSERALSELPVSTTVLDQATIEQSSAATVDDLLRTIPGVHMMLGSSIATHVSGERFSMRGLGGNRALVLLDGVPMHDPYHGTVEWEKVPLDSIQQIEVVRGGNASLFGNMALGGTVNVVTRPVDSNRISAGASWGSFSTGRAMLTVDRKIGDDLGVRLSYHRLSSDGFPIAVEPGPIDIPVWNDTSIASLRADYHPSPGTNGFVKLSRSQIDMSTGTISSLAARRIVDLALGLHHAVGDRDLFSATFFRQDEEIHIVSTTVVGGVSNYVSNDSTVPTSGTGLSLEWSGQRNGSIRLLSAGVDVQQMEAKENRNAFAPSGALTEQDVVRGRQRFAGIFGQMSWRPLERLEILTSARFDHYRNSNGSDVVVGGEKTLYPETTTTQLDPRISIRYALGPRSALRAGAYRAFNAPKLRELYRNAQTGTTYLLGNPYLKPETLLGAEVGYEQVISRGHVEVNLYRSDISGLILRGNLPGQPANVVQYVNVGKARSQGIEAMASLRLSPRWNTTLGYTWADSTIVSNPEEPELIGNQVPEVVPHIGTLTVAYRGPAGLQADVRYRILSRSYGELANVRPAPAHRVLDLSLSRPINQWLDLYAKVDNALNEHYYYVLTPRATRATEPRNLTWGARIHLPGTATGVRER